MRAPRSSLALLAWAAAACESPAGSPDTGPPVDAADPTVDETRSLTIGPIEVPPGGEDTVCVVLDLGNDAPRMVRAIRTELTAGTHHVIVTRSEQPLSPTPTSCGAFAGGAVDSEVLFIVDGRQDPS